MNNGLIRMDVSGLQELLTYLGDLGDKAPRQALAKGVRKATTQIMNDAKNDAPVYSGTMRNALKLKTETGNTRKLKVAIDVMFDPAMNSVFQKPVSKEGAGKFGGIPNSAGMYYYPASMEYGFKTEKGWQPGHYFMRQARDENDTKFFDTIEKTLNDEIDRLG